ATAPMVSRPSTSIRPRFLTARTESITLSAAPSTARNPLCHLRNPCNSRKFSTLFISLPPAARKSDSNRRLYFLPLPSEGRGPGLVVEWRRSRDAPLCLSPLKFPEYRALSFSSNSLWCSHFRIRSLGFGLC